MRGGARSAIPEQRLQPDRDMAALESILVPVDGSPPSFAALDHAIALAEDTGARVDVLHVVYPDEVSGASLRSLSEDELADLERAVEAAVARARERIDGRVMRQTISGDLLRTILETAREGPYDLIVIGTHGYIGRLHSLLGSVAEEVVRNAPCPVLTVRETGGGYQSFAERRHRRPSVAEQASEPK